MQSLEKLDPEYITVEQFTQGLLGHFWGGVLLMHYAVKYPHNISGQLKANRITSLKVLNKLIDEENL